MQRKYTDYEKRLRRQQYLAGELQLKDHIPLFCQATDFLTSAELDAEILRRRQRSATCCTTSSVATSPRSWATGGPPTVEDLRQARTTFVLLFFSVLIITLMVVAGRFLAFANGLG